MQDNRGLKFLVGIVSIWLLWRLDASEWFFRLRSLVDGYMMEGGPPQTVMLSSGQVVGNGPGALVVGFIFEAIITFGWFVILVATGLWSAASQVGRAISEIAGVGLAYVKQVAPKWGVKLPQSESKPKPTVEVKPKTPRKSKQEQLAEMIGGAVEKSVAPIGQKVDAIGERVSKLEGDKAPAKEAE